MPPVVAEQRQKELKLRKEIYQWDWVTDHMPGSIKAETHDDLPRDVQFTDEKSRSEQRYINCECIIKLVLLYLFMCINILIVEHFF